MTNKIPQEIKEKILKYIKDKAKKEGYKWETTKHLQEAISLAFQEGRTQTLEKVKEKIEEFKNNLKNCDEFFNVKDYGNTVSTDKFMGIVELYLREFLSKLEDDEVEK